MNLFIEIKYLLQLSGRLTGFKKKSDYLWNCRCPLCGDSLNSKSKARGYFHRDKKNPTRLRFKCHNCQESPTLGSLLQQLDPTLYNEYRLESYRSLHPAPPIETPTPNTPLELPKSITTALCCRDLPTSHPCVQYLSKRRIPQDQWSRLYYTENYRHYVMECFPTFVMDLNGTPRIKIEPRLVIPFRDTSGRIVAATGRSFSDNSIRYVTVRDPATTEKLVFGLDYVDQSRRVYIVEGPLDSLCIENAVASGDSNLIAVAERLTAREITLVFDNEKRNRENIRQIERAIQRGYSVVIWASTVYEKDLNKMMQNGMTSDQIREILDTHTYSGLTAQIHLNEWKRISQPRRNGVLR